jgi:hypothetical protein
VIRSIDTFDHLIPFEDIAMISASAIVLSLALGGVGGLHHGSHATPQAPTKCPPVPGKVCPAPQAPAKVCPAPQAPAKVCPAPQAPAKVCPAPQAPTKCPPAPGKACPAVPAKAWPAAQAAPQY